MKTGADNLQRYISLRETLGLTAMLARWIIRIEKYLVLTIQVHFNSLMLSGSHARQFLNGIEARC